MAGDLNPGEAIREEKIADQLNLSRTPVREALRQLAAEGHIDISHNRGATVVSEDIDQLFELRILLEGYAAGVAAERITLEELDRLRAVQQRFDDVLHDVSIERGELAKLNLAFHGAIRAACRNARLEAFIRSLTSVSLAHATFGSYTVEQLDRSRSQHWQLIEALERHDRPLAEMAMRVHISGARYAVAHDVKVTRSPTRGAQA